MPDDLPSRRRAIRLLEADRRAVLDLIEPLPRRALGVPGLGGGDWSLVDLLGHLESWEEHALGALEAWERGEPAPIDRALRSAGLNGVNLAEVKRKADRTPQRALASASATHERLIRAIGALTEVRWQAPATGRARKPLGRKLGGILGGPAGYFRHDAAHLSDLRAFVAAL
jgi:hypothetical protein